MYGHRCRTQESMAESARRKDGRKPQDSQTSDHVLWPTWPMLSRMAAEWPSKEKGSPKRRTCTHPAIDYRRRRPSHCELLCAHGQTNYTFQFSANRACHQKGRCQMTQFHHPFWGAAPRRLTHQRHAEPAWFHSLSLPYRLAKSIAVAGHLLAAFTE